MPNYKVLQTTTHQIPRSEKWIIPQLRNHI